MDPDHEDQGGDEGGNEVVPDHEIAVENNPTLPEVEVKTHEEEEEVLFKMYVRGATGALCAVFTRSGPRFWRLWPRVGVAGWWWWR